MSIELPGPLARRLASRRQLAARRARMPVIDVARVPWRVLRERWPNRAPWVYLWLHVLRPVVVTLFWLATVRYAWKHFFGLPEDLPVWQQVTLYGVAVLVIVLLMLLLAPMRRREQQREPAAEEAESTLGAISEFANVQPEDLERWQQTQRLVVHHDASGGLDSAEETAGPPGGALTAVEGKQAPPR